MSPSVAVPELSTAIWASFAPVKVSPSDAGALGASQEEGSSKHGLPPGPFSASITLVPRAEKSAGVPSGFHRLIVLAAASITRTSPFDWSTAKDWGLTKFG